MNQVRTLSLFVLGLSLAVSLAAGDDYETFRITLPKGDVEEGRKAFVELSCTSCHAVVGESFEKRVSAHPGPTLGAVHAAHARLDPGDIATAILSPSHIVTTEAGDDIEGDLSPMGDFTEAMTVRQWLDLLAYLRSVGAEKKGESAGTP